MPTSILLWTALLLVAIVLPACGSDIDLHGVWTGEDEDGPITLTLDRDGSYELLRGQRLDGEDTTAGEAGKWRYEHPDIHMEPDVSNLPPPEGAPYTYYYGLGREWRALASKGSVQFQEGFWTTLLRSGEVVWRDPVRLRRAGG